MTPLFVVILILAVAWRLRNPPNVKRLFIAHIRKPHERPKPARPVRRR